MQSYLAPVGPSAGIAGSRSVRRGEAGAQALPERLASYIDNLTDVSEEVRVGALASDLVKLRDELNRAVPPTPNLNDGQLASLAEKINLFLLCERVYLHAHNIQMVRASDRSPDVRPFGDGLDLDEKVFARLTPFGKRETLRLTNAQTERLLSGEDVNAQAAMVLIRLNKHLIGNSPRHFHGKSYFEAIATLHLIYLYSRSSQLDPVEELLRDVGHILPSVGESEGRDEVAGLYHLYGGQLKLVGGRFDEAVGEYRKSVDAFVRAGNPNAVEAYGALAQAYIASGAADKVPALAAEAAAFKEKLKDRFPPEEFARGELTLQVTLLQARFFMKDFARMREEVEAVKDRLNADAGASAHTYVGLSFLEESDDCRKALPEFEAGLKLIGDEASRGAELLHLKAGECKDRLGEPAEALEHFERAFFLDRDLRKSARGSSAYPGVYRDDFVVEIEQAASKVIYDLMTKQGADARGLAEKLLFYGEMVKSRGILDEVEATSTGLFAVGPGTTPEQISIATELLRNLGIPAPSAGTASNDPSKTFRTYQGFVGSLGKRHGAPALLVEYVPVPERDRVLIFAIDEKNVAWAVLPMTWNKITGCVAEYRRAVEQSLRLYERLRKSPVPARSMVELIRNREEAINRLGAELGATLLPDGVQGFGDLRKYVRDKHLVIVPHGPLHNLPFTSLRLADGASAPYLIDVAASYTTAPSSALLLAISEREGRRQAKLIDNVLLVGERDDPTLPAVDAEFKGIEAAVDKARHVLSKSEVLTAARGAAAVHFGSHAFFDRSNPAQSGLKLKDGTLTLNEITGFNSFHPRVVTMGACESGEASVSSGDDVWSLATAFLFSGSPAVVGSLWEQDGATARDFYTTFYAEATKEGNVQASFLSAIRRVGTSSRAEPEANDVAGLMNNHNPCFWAGFTLIGE